jgi:integrase
VFQVEKRRKKLGVYRRKDERGKHYGPYIVQYPYRIDPITRRAVWNTCTVHGSKNLARRVYQQKLVEWERKKYLKQEAKKEYTFGDLLEWYLDHPKAKRKKTYVRDIEMGKILRENFGARPAREIKPTDIEAFQDKMLRTLSKRRRPFKPATVNRFVTLFKRVYNLAIRDDMVEKNPCWKVPLLPERNVRDRIVSREEFETLQNELPEYILILSLGYYLGMREGEILNLRGKQIRFYENGVEEGYIELYDSETKTGEGRRIPFGGLIGRLLKDHLITRKKRDLESFLFITGRGNLLGNFRRGFQRACRRAGIRELCFHDFRHTAITNMRKAGVNISVIMAISGHKTMAMFRRYNRIDLDDGREAMKKVEDYLSGNQQAIKSQSL